MDIHVIGKWSSYEQAVHVVQTLEQEYPQQVSLSTSTPHEHWWHHSPWITGAIEAAGGAAAAVSQLVPGFGVLFMGGTLDGLRQGQIIGQWLEAHPDVPSDEHAHFVIVSGSREDTLHLMSRMEELGGQQIHTVP